VLCRCWLVTGMASGLIKILRRCRLLSTSVQLCSFSCCAPAHSGWALSIDGRRLSVHLSLCPVPGPTLRTEGHSKLNIGRKEANGTGNLSPHFDGQRSRSVGRLLLRQKVHHIFRRGDRRHSNLVPKCIVTSESKVKVMRLCRQSDACLLVT